MAKRSEKPAVAVSGGPRDPARTDTYWVIDESGSMAEYSEEIRRQITRLVSSESASAAAAAAAGRHFFICFSNHPLSTTDLNSIRIVGGGTQIGPAFEALNEQLLTNAPLPGKVVVVFVSDGADNNARTIVARLKAGGGPIHITGLTSVLFTVAVGRDFPTNMVCDALRPNFHTASDYLPLVFPLDSPAQGECTEAFDQLHTYMTQVDHAMGAPLIDEHSSQEEVERAANAIYSCHVMRCTREQDKAKVVAILDDAKAQLEGIAAAVRERDARRAAALAGAQLVDAAKPLLSRLIHKHKQERRSSLALLLDLATKLNQLKNEAAVGRILARLNDTDLAKALGYGSVVGRHLAKSVKYHSAEIQQTKRSLVEYLTKYTPEQAACDEQVSDFVINQAEAILDAKASVDAIVAADIGSVVALVDVLALVGRTLQVRTSDGTQINPWLVQVEGMPAIMRTMNSVDFFEQYKGAYSDPHCNETANCLLPITTNPASILSQYVGQHLTTFFLTKNEALCFQQSLAALVAAAVTFCVARPQPLPAWVQGELEQALTSYVCVYERGARPKPMGISSKYFARLVSPRASSCFQTESAADPDVKCEHLTKAVLALLLLIRRGRRAGAAAAAGGAEADGAAAGLGAGAPPLFHPDSAALRQLMMSFLAEMVGRSIDRSKTLVSFLPVPAMKATVEDLVASVDSKRALGAYTLTEALSWFAEDVAAVATRSNPDTGIAGSVSECLQGLDDLGVSCYQFTESSVVSIFASLDVMLGNASPADSFRLSPEERVAVLAHALQYPTSAERCATQVAAYDAQQLEQLFVASHIRRVGAAAESFMQEAYTKSCVAIHAALPMTFPLSFTTRFKAETGHDLDLTLGINPETRLPRCACSSKGCPGFLHVVKSSHLPTAVPCISNELLNHLAPVGVPVAFARTLTASVKRGDSPEVAARKVLACSEMLPCEPDVKARAVRSLSAWWARLEPSAAQALQGEASGATLWAGPEPQGAGGPVSELPPLLVKHVAASMALLAAPEARWGGYEGFKREVSSALRI